MGGARIAVISDIRREEAGAVGVETKVLGLHRIPVVFDRIIKIDHLHLDAVIIIIYGVYLGQMNLSRFDDGKIEVVGLCRRAGNNSVVFQINL